MYYDVRTTVEASFEWDVDLARTNFDRESLAKSQSITTIWTIVVNLWNVFTAVPMGTGPDLFEHKLDSRRRRKGDTIVHSVSVSVVNSLVRDGNMLR